ncbi:hypothetical protein CR513_30100, partial [Mucuna pruriens]
MTRGRLRREVLQKLGMVKSLEDSRLSTIPKEENSMTKLKEAKKLTSKKKGVKEQAYTEYKVGLGLGLRLKSSKLLSIPSVEVPESVIKFSLKRGATAQRQRKNKGSVAIDPVEMAREKFQIAAKAGCDLGFKWLARLEEEEKRLLTEGH